MKISLLSSTVILLLVLSVPASAQELPLSGAAYRIAESAYGAYARGDYALAEKQAREAVRLRPDVVRLQLLQIYALQKLGRGNEARRQARNALDAGLKDPALPGLAAAVSVSSVRSGEAKQQTPAERAYQHAFALATRAYTAFNEGRLSIAASSAEQAFRQQPQEGAWAMLWVAALEAQQQFEQAKFATEVALQLGAPNAVDLQAKRVALGRELAVKPAQDGYQALIAQDFGTAVKFASEAVARAPDVASHRLLLLTAQLLDGQLQDAEHTADQALENDSEDTVALVMRAYLRQRQGKSAQANDDFDAAMKQDWLDTQQQQNVRLLAVDAAIAAGDRERATALLVPLQDVALEKNDEVVQKGIRQAIATRTKAILAAQEGRPMTLQSYPAPFQQCRDTPYGTHCELMPEDLRGGGGAAQRAYAAYGRQDYQQAIVEARQAVQESPDNVTLQGLLTTALAAGNRTQQGDAMRRLDSALSVRPEDSGLLMQRGYLNQRIDKPALALADFRAAEATGKAPKAVVLDQAYASAAMGNTKQAVSLLRNAIDQADAGQLPLNATQRYNTRSAIAGYQREWGMSASTGYRSARQASMTSGGAAISSVGDSLFGTMEAFWRPSAVNNQHGVLEAYVRLAGTLYDEGGTYESLLMIDPCTGDSRSDLRDSVERMSRSRSTTGFPSTVGSLGLRYSFGQTGFSLGLERRQFFGTATRGGGIYAESAMDRCRIQVEAERPLQVNAVASYRFDSSAGGWMTYATYGFYKGTAMRTDVDHWWTLSGYTQLGFSWDDNRADFLVDALNSSGVSSIYSVNSSGRLRRQQAFAAAELRLGRTYRVGAELARWMITPSLVVGADWLDQRSRVRGIEYPVIGRQSFLLSDTNRDWSLGAGTGVGLRYIFREDHYNAARSYLDISVQYRMALGGGDAQRAKGLFATASLYY